MSNSQSNSAVNPQSPSRRKFLLGVAIGAVLASISAVVVSIYRALHRTKTASPTSGDLALNLHPAADPGLEAHRRIDPTLFTYRQLEAIPTGLSKPHCLALDAQGQLWVAGDRKLIQLNHQGERLQQHDLPQAPTCLTVDQQGIAWVAMPRSIMAINTRAEAPGQVVIAWEAGADHSRSHWTALAVGKDRLYLADAGQRAVVIYSRGGQRLAVWDQRKGHRWIVPSPYFDLALVPSEDSLWVTNPGQHRIEHLDVQGCSLGSIGQYAVQVSGFCGCCNPTHLAIWLNDEQQIRGFVTAEKGTPRVKVIDAQGRCIGVVAGPDHISPGVAGLDLVINSVGTVYVLDPLARSVRRFEPLEDWLSKLKA